VPEGTTHKYFHYFRNLFRLSAFSAALKKKPDRLKPTQFTIWNWLL